MEKLQDWLTLYLTHGIGSVWCRRLVDHFHNPTTVLAAGLDQLMKVPGFTRAAANALVTAPAREAAVKELIIAQKRGVAIIAWDDPLYPPLLKNIYNPPVLLYVKGNPHCLASDNLAIVGARAATTYGKNSAQTFAMQMAKFGVGIVSGLALGVDTAAHNGALAAGGATIAVLGCGLDVIYPPQNKKLFAAIPAIGALVTEYPFATKPDPFRFPARNRIISGLSLGVLVVEAAKSSGSLITARLALEQGREVFAVPGRVDSNKSEGTHQLLKEGAKLVHTVSDILEELRLSASGPVAAPGVISPCQKKMTTLPSCTAEEAALLDYLEVYPKTIDELIRDTKLPAAKVSELLLMLELKNAVQALPGQQFKKCVEFLC